MKIIAIVSEKGGAGKTMTAVTLATAAENHGLATVIFDVDPRANSAVWGDKRPDQIPQVVPAQVPRLAVLFAKAKEQGADLVIIDTPGNDLPTAEAVSPYADLILIPCQPSPPDLVSIVPTVKVALTSGKLSFVLINRAPAIGNETDEAREAIEAAGVPVCPVVFYARKAFTSRFHEGLTAFDIEPKGKAAEEGRALFLWAAEQIGLITTKKASKKSSKNVKQASNIAEG
jgi:chromosome partitioning protein